MRWLRYILMTVLALNLGVWMGCSSPSSSGDSSLRPRLKIGNATVAPSRDQNVDPTVPGVNEARSPENHYRLQSGDPVIVYLRGIGREMDEVEDIVDEQGNISLPYLNEFRAVNKTTSDLEKDIRKAYIDGKIYRDVSINVVMPSQSYFIRGEVKQPGRYPIITGITILQAIATAGGYTEFASPRNVKLIRGQQSISYNMNRIEKNPEKDIKVESGDVIVVDRSIF